MTGFPISEATSAYVSRRLNLRLEPYFLVMLRRDTDRVTYRSVARCEHEADAQCLVELVNRTLNHKPKETNE